MRATVLDEAMREPACTVPRWQLATWFEPLTFVSDAGAIPWVRAPNSLFGDWFDERYAGMLNEALARVGRADTRVKLLVPAAEWWLRTSSARFDMTDGRLARID
jgi:chromosomal replication initiation ATPase DnaA